MYIPRLITRRLEEIARSFPVVIVSGARQSGKTTLLRHAFPHHNYVSLDLPSLAAQAETEPDRFLHDHPLPLLVDEVQYAPGLFRHVKAVVDADRHTMGRVLLTGSQQFHLMKGVADSLAGRCGLLDLENLSLPEIDRGASVGSASSDTLRAMTRGQFPELWRLPDLPERDFHASYVATYLERDVRQLLNVTSLRDFERFIRVLAARSGSLLNKSDVAKDVGVSVKAVGDWLSVLQASGQIILLEPWFTSFGKRVVKSPKVYFRDSGLLCFLLGIDAASVSGSAALGPIWETFVFAELRKANDARGGATRFWYYRDQRAREIDFVIESGGLLSFVECKRTEHPSIEGAKTIRAVSEELDRSGGPWKAGRHYLLGTPAASYRIADGVEAVGIRDIDRVLGN